ncbi:hypothetical protein [Halalkalicoccus salilacus]
MNRAEPSVPLETDGEAAGDDRERRNTSGDRREPRAEIARREG